MPDAESNGEPITEEGIAALREEIEQLEGPAAQEMAARIKVAREEGDLKENAEYHIAKDDQAHLETQDQAAARAAAHRGRGRGRRRRRVASPSAAPPRSSTRAKTKVNTWTLVGSTEADLAAGRLSAESPIGRALRDAKVGEPIEVETPHGSRTFVVRKLLG